MSQTQSKFIANSQVSQALLKMVPVVSIFILCLYMIRATTGDYHEIESILPHWLYSNQTFPFETSFSIIALDEKHSKIIIVGGDMDIFSMYIYDLITQRLLTITHNITFPSSKKSDPKTLDNFVSTNSFIWNGTMYIAWIYGVHKVNLQQQIYSKITNLTNMNNTQPLLSNVLLRGNWLGHDYGNAHGGCIVQYTINDTGYLIATAFDYDKYTLVHNLNTSETFVASDTKRSHYEGACVIQNDILYVMGGQSHPGKVGNTVDYVSVYDLIIYKENFRLFKQVFPPNYQNDETEMKYFGIINDEDNGFIYTLGGYNRKHDICRINTATKSIERLNVFINISKGIAQTSTIYVKDTNTIYAFRGSQGKKIIYASNHSKIISTTTTTSHPGSNTQKNGFLILLESVSTIDWILLIIIFGILVVCCTVFWCEKWKKSIEANHPYKQMKDDNNNITVNNNDIISTIKIISDDDDDESSIESYKTQRVIDTTITESKQKELFEIYETSKLNCFNKCEEFGYSDRMIEQLITRFDAKLENGQNK